MKSLPRILMAVVAAIGLTSFAASPAQAKELRLRINEEVIPFHETVVTGSISKFTFKFGPFEIICTKMETTKSHLRAGNRVRKTEFKITGCTAGKTLFCNVPEPIVTPELEGEAINIGEVVYMTYEPEEGETFVEFELTGEECPLLGIPIQVTGNVCGEGTEVGSELVSQPFTFSEGISEVCETQLEFEGEPVSITGEVTTN